MTDIKFVDGMIIKAPRQGAPDFVKAAISIKRAELTAWLGSDTSEWINIDVKESKGGKWYAQVNEWEPDQAKVDETRASLKEKAATQSAPNPDDIPF